MVGDKVCMCFPVASRDAKTGLCCGEWEKNIVFLYCSATIGMRGFRFLFIGWVMFFVMLLNFLKIRNPASNFCTLQAGIRDF